MGKHAPQGEERETCLGSWLGQVRLGWPTVAVTLVALCDGSA